MGVDFIGEIPVEFGAEVSGDFAGVIQAVSGTFLGSVLDSCFDILDKVLDFLIGLEVFLPAAVEEVGACLALGAGGDAFVGYLVGGFDGDLTFDDITVGDSFIGAQEFHEVSELGHVGDSVVEFGESLFLFGDGHSVNPPSG